MSAAKPLTEEQQASVDLLRESLLEAEAGNVTSVGIAVCMKGGFASVMAGYQAADLNLACDDLKAKILAAVTAGNVRKPVNKSSIIRVK